MISIVTPDLAPLLAKLAALEDLTTILTDSFDEIDARFCSVQSDYYAGLGGRYHDTGNLRDSLTRPGHPDHVATVSSAGVTLGTAVEYAQYLGPEAVVRMDAGDVLYVVGEPVRERIERIWSGR